MKIFVRSDLKMRKGKMAAQSAHATNKLFLEYTNKNEKFLSLSSIIAKSILEKDKIKDAQVFFVKNEHELNEKESSRSTSIIDHGRTEFNGVKTKTVLCSDMIQHDIIERFEPTEDRDIFAKQIILFSKEFPLSKENACKMAGVSSLENLVKMFYVGEDANLYFNLNDDSAEAAWLNGAFAKISLSTKTDDEFFSIMKKLILNKIKFTLIREGDNIALCTNPCFPERIDPITGHLSLI